MRNAFHEWLTTCWNNLYEVWSPDDCDQRIVHFGNYTSSDKFITWLNMIYGCVVTEFPYGVIKGELMKDNKFILYLDGKTVEIRPFDDEVYNIDLIKEDD